MTNPHARLFVRESGITVSPQDGVEEKATVPTKGEIVVQSYAEQGKGGGIRRDLKRPHRYIRGRLPRKEAGTIRVR